MARKATQQKPVLDVQVPTAKFTYLTRSGQGQSFADALRKFGGSPSPVLATLCNTWCDNLPDTERAAVLLPLLNGVANSGRSHDMERSGILMAWAFDAVNAWLVLIGMREHCQTMTQAKDEPYSHAAAMIAPIVQVAIGEWDDCRTGSGERIKLYVQDAARQAVESCGLIAAMTGAQAAEFSAPRSQLIGFLRQIADACAKIAAVRASQQAMAANTIDTGGVSSLRVAQNDNQLRAWDAFHKVRQDLQDGLKALVAELSGTTVD